MTEALLFCHGLYTQLGAPGDMVVHVGIRHGGLRGRALGSAGRRHVGRPRTASEDEVYTEVAVRLDEIRPKIVQLVKELTAPLFTLFDFLEIGDQIYYDIVTEFIAGKVT